MKKIILLFALFFVSFNINAQYCIGKSIGDADKKLKSYDMVKVKIHDSTQTIIYDGLEGSTIIHWQKKHLSKIVDIEVHFVNTLIHNPQGIRDLFNSSTTWIEQKTDNTLLKSPSVVSTEEIKAKSEIIFLHIKTHTYARIVHDTEHDVYFIIISKNIDIK